MEELVLISFNEKEIEAKIRLCTYMAKSGIIPKALQGKPQDVYIIIQYGFELGLPPMQSLQSIYVVNGTPCCSGQLMLALIYRDFPNAIVQLFQNEEVAFEKMLVTCTMARNKDSRPTIVKWDKARSDKMGLSSKDNWQKQPGTMLKWKAIAECSRLVFPDVIKGLRTNDEVEDDLIYNIDGTVAGNKKDRRYKDAIKTDETNKLNEEFFDKKESKDFVDSKGKTEME